jgi:Holliday junction DNA helicase RuvA
MIGSLRGTLIDRGADEITVEVGGVGYRVTVSPTTAVSLGDLSAEVFCWVHHHQREDDVTLYGFATKDERACFEALLGAHGVGPALALAILSIHTPVALARILAEDDLGALCLVPGVGKKTAARLLIDLKSRLSVPDLGTPVLPDGSAATSPTTALADVRGALAELGYSEPELREVVADLPPDGEAGALLRDALQRLAAARR